MVQVFGLGAPDHFFLRAYNGLGTRLVYMYTTCTIEVPLQMTAQIQIPIKVVLPCICPLP